MDIFRGADELKPFLNYTWLRHKVIISNIANADTPGYRAKDVVFKRDLGEVIKLKRTRKKHFKGSESDEPFRMVYDPDHPMANEEGYVMKPNIDLAKEMANMISAIRSYEANMTAFNMTREMAERTLELWR